MTIFLTRKNMMRNATGFVIAGLCLVLAGCTGASDPASTSLERTIAVPSSSSQMVALATEAPSVNAPGSHAPSQPFVALPGDAGTVSSLRSHDYVNGFRQDILLKGSAVRAVPNSLTLLARISRQATLDEATPLFKPTEAAIRSEMGREFPHVSMQVVERPSSNAYGPYGLALGRADGNVHCLYMWQWIDENRLPPDAGVTGPVSVRVRLCLAGTTFDAMAALVDHLTIGREAGSSYAVNDIAGIVADPADVTPKASAPRRHIRRLAAHRARAVTVARRDLVPDSSLSAPAPTPPGPASPSALATDLPPQAYLGPKATGAPRSN